MYPFIRLRLSDAKQIALYLLRRIQPEAHQDEQQPVTIRFQLPPSPTAIAALPRPALNVVFYHVCLPCLLKRRQQLLELAQTNSCQTLKDARLVSQTLVGQHRKASEKKFLLLSLTHF